MCEISLGFDWFFSVCFCEADNVFCGVQFVIDLEGVEGKASVWDAPFEFYGSWRQKVLGIYSA